MKTETLALIYTLLNSIPIDYSFGDATNGNRSRPYWSGEVSSIASGLEDQVVDSDFSLFGYGVDWLALETQKESIIDKLDGYGGLTTSGRGVSIHYETSQAIPCDDPDLKRMEIRFSIKEFNNGIR